MREGGPTQPELVLGKLYPVRELIETIYYLPFHGYA